MRRRRSPMIRVLFLVVAARLCFAPPLTWSLGVVASEEKHKEELKLVNDYDYPIVRLTTVEITSESYRAFIAELRRYLGSNNEERHQIPLLPRDTSVTIGTRFVLVEISNWEEQSVTLALDVTDVYVVGYRAGNHSVFFQPDRPDVKEAIQHLFTDTARVILPFPGRYDAMTVSRESVPLGTQALEDSVSSMYRYAQQPSPSAQNSLVRGFLVTIQMVSEAARFRYLEHDFSQRILYGRNTEPDPSVIALENAWGRLSSQIRDTGEGRPFSNPVQLLRRNRREFSVNNVTPFLIGIIALLRNVRSGPQSSLSSSSSSTPLLRLVTSTKPAEDATTTTMATANYNMVEVEEEPTLRIVGPDGMCMDVKEEHYNNGNPIILWPCKSSNNWNQLWTFKADGTIQSNGKCLAYGYSPGGYVMIYDCNPQSVAFIWQAWDNGTIVSGSGVALSVPSSAAGTELTVEYPNYAVGQGWRPTNNTEPLVAPIVGVFGLCLQVLQGNGDGGGHLLMQPCALGMSDQQWALYPDGSIRPQESSSSCLTAPGGGADAPVTVSSCDLSSAMQRWEFTNDGTIVTLRDKLVLEAQGYSNPFLSQIIVNGYTGSPSQMWQALVLL